MDSLIIGILGDILGFKTFKEFGKIIPVRFTKKRFGDKYKDQAINTAVNKYLMFIADGGINQDIKDLKYSFNTLMLFATLKGMSEGKDFKKNCTDEYVKLYNKYGSKKLDEMYYANNLYLESLKSLVNSQPIQLNDKYDDSIVLSRVLPFGLLYWKKEDRSKLVSEIIDNLSITHKNITCYLGGITLGLFVSFKKNGVNVEKWANKLVEFLLSTEFDNMIKEHKLYNTEFMITKEDYISAWNGYLNNSFIINNKTDEKYILQMISPINRANYLFHTFNDPFANEFIYGLNTIECMIIAYDSLLYSNGYWEKMFMYGGLGITNNSVMGCICGMLFGIEYGLNSSINKVLFKDESWLKKLLMLSKNL
jgi:ADP-ribosylglycohydrolase